MRTNLKRRDRGAALPPNEHLRDLFDNTTNLIQSVAPDGTLVSANRAWREALGYSAAESIGLSMFDVIHPGSRAHCGRLFERLLAGEDVGVMDVTFVAKDGHSVDLQGSTSVRWDNGMPVMTRGIFMDVTAAKRVDRQLSRLWSLPLVMLFIVGSDWRFKEVSRGVVEALGWSPDDLIGHHFEEFRHVDDLEAGAPMAELPADVRTMLTRFRRKDGTWSILAAEWTPGADVGGRGDFYVSVRDVTRERKAAAEISRLNANLEQRVEERTAALQRQEAMNRLLLENLGDGVVACDANGNPTIFNRVAREWHGLDPDAIPADERGSYNGLYADDGVTPLGTEEIPLLRALRGERVRGAEMTIVAAGQSPRLVVVSGERLQDATGQTLGAVVAMHDVTGSRQTLNTLRIKDRQLTEAEETAHFGSFESDLVSGVLTWSAELRRIFGVDSTFVPTPANHFEFFEPDEREGIQHIVAQAVDNRGSYIFEAWITGADGVSRRLETRGRVIVSADGTPVRIIGVSQDITERVAAERQMRQAHAVLDAMVDGAFIFHPTTLRLLYVNEGAVRQLGYTRDELLTMTPVDVKPEFDEARFREMLAPLLQGSGRTHLFLTQHRHRDGHDIPVEINLQYVAPEAEAPWFIAIVRDVTERVQLQQQANRSQRLEAIGTLAGGVAHDLNNALAPILMGVEILRSEYPAEVRLLDTFETSGRRASDMVRQLLTFAKGRDVQRVSIQPRHLVKELDGIMGGTFPKNIRLDVKTERDLPVVLGDPTQIHQVLLNLCVNARDAMPDGGTLTLEAYATDVDATFVSAVGAVAPGPYLVFRVRDTGAGIPPDVLDRIFDPFFTTKAPDRGTGLGLSTVMGIVKGHGGFLQVDSVPGRGSVFSAFLPADEEGGSVDAIPAAAAEFRGSGERILFVDDEASLRTTGRMVLEWLQFTVVTATDGADALIQVAENRSDLRAVITDVHMPHMDGLTFVGMLRRMMPDLPVVVASGRLDDETAAAFRKLGVTRRIDKPFTQKQLAAVLQTVVGPAATRVDRVPTEPDEFTL